MHLNITGFGGCMISGFPLSEETGFLRQAVGQLEENHQELELHLEIVSLGGFPVDRAQKHFHKKIWPLHPDIVVLQFGSTDAGAHFRRGFGVRHLFKSQGHSSSPKVSPEEPTTLDLVKWQLRGLGSEILRVPPLTPLDSYLASILRMVNECVAAGVIVVVLSPFVMSGTRNNRFAAQYSQMLKRQLPLSSFVHFLDAHALLSHERRSQVLLRDGFHLSPRGHQVLAVGLGQLLAKIATRAERPKTSATAPRLEPSVQTLAENP